MNMYERESNLTGAFVVGGIIIGIILAMCIYCSFKGKRVVKYDGENYDGD